MPDIAPFSPYRYNAQTHPDLGLVIAPPYDVIPDERLEQLLTQDPHNVIRIILPRGGDDRYRQAGDRLKSWIRNGVLVHEDAPAIYPYSQHFIHPEDGTTRSRSGLVVVMRLEEFAEGNVLPHERTLSGPKADRLRLMRETNGNVEAIFGMYNDPEGRAASRLQTIRGAGDPLIDAVDADGVQHRLWRVTDRSVIDDYVAEFREKKVIIVDGHHRYETALTFREEARATGGMDVHAESPADWIMIFLASSSDPGMLILPTHRIVHSVPGFSYTDLIDILQDCFDVRTDIRREDALERLAAPGNDYRFLLLRGDQSALITLRHGVDVRTLASPGTPDPLAVLDVTILHDYIFERLLGITRSAQEDQLNLRYVKSTDDALEASIHGDVDVVVMMRAPTVEQVTAVAETGFTMPQKSTYFYPKLASGLLFNLFSSGT